MKKINFMKQHKSMFFTSLMFMFLSIGMFFTVGFNYGIDFKGGVITELKFEESTKADDLKEYLKNDEKELTIYNAGSSELLVIETETISDYKFILAHIKENEKWKNVKLIKNEFIGPKVGEELKTNGLLALLIVIISVLIYISVRFEFRFAVGAIFALLHDIIITMGMVSLFGIEVNLTTLAAILALLGYSLNDTIVVYDRIRENFQKFSELEVYDIINVSLNETLSRTIMTSITTAGTLLSILLFAGASLKGFSIVLLFGVLIGTYSSIYIASNVLILLKVRKDQFKKEKIDRENGVI